MPRKTQTAWRWCCGPGRFNEAAARCRGKRTWKPGEKASLTLLQ